MAPPTRAWQHEPHHSGRTTPLNFRIAISAFPGGADPSRARLLAAIAEATGVSSGDLLGRIEASPAWLIEVPDREEAEAWRALLDRQRGVSTALMPALGPPVPSLRAALDRARVAMGEPVSGPRGLARVADRQARLSAPSAPAAPPSSPPTAGVRRRGITAPVGFVEGDEPADVAPPPSRERRPKLSGPTIPSRGITAPVDFLRGGPGDAVTTTTLQDDSAAADAPPTSPDDQPPSSPPARVMPRDRHGAPPRPRDSHGGPRDLDRVELERRARARGAAPTFAPAGQRRAAIDVKMSLTERLIGPLVRFVVPAIVVVAAVLAWRYANREVVNKPEATGVELLDAGQAPRAPLRITPTGEREDYSVALGLEHHFATRQISALERISTIGGPAWIEYEHRGDDYFDVSAQGDETRLGRQRLEPIRVLDHGHTGAVPPPDLSWLPEDDHHVMRAFSRLIRPPFMLLPADPVGLGAQWRYIWQADQSPIGLPVEITVEMLGRDEQRVELGVEIRYIGEHDPGETSLSSHVFGPFRPRFDSPVRVFDLRGAGRGRATVSLDRLTPISLDVDVRFEARVEVHTAFGVQLIGYEPVMSLEMHSD